MSKAATTLPRSVAKTIVLGDPCVGKTSLTMRFVDGSFRPDGSIPNISCTFYCRRLQLPDKAFEFQIWDTAGQERYMSLTRMYYRRARAALIVYDITSRDSFVKAKFWLDELRRSEADPDVQITLVGNKRDLHDKRQVPEDEGRTLALAEGIEFIETSAKDGLNVDAMMMALALRISSNEATAAVANSLTLSTESVHKTKTWRESCTC
eukprot:GILI01019157.1.p1 GENE.GILI01019157.1~~GILI01019157.1.p1  ORF type:complete len:208 (+),score=11.68 GILI01019157.1:325-948(+)